MARSRSSPSRRSAPAAKKAPAPVQQSAPAPAPVHTQQSSGPGLLGTIAEGMAFGTGSAIAHRTVGAIANSIGGSGEKSEAPAQTAAPSTSHSTTISSAPTAPTACFNDQKAFMDCLQANKNDVASCQFYFDQYNMCKSQSSFQSLP